MNRSEITLHVGAGTFLPVKSENVVDHPMHREHFSISRSELEKIANAQNRIAVGTTSLRLLESLYWISEDPGAYANGKTLEKLRPYNTDLNFSYSEALVKILDYMSEQGTDTFESATEIMILPTYKIKSVNALITNFHLPESTLLMIIASAVGDAWKSIYQSALEQQYRFLSYGDGSLLYISESQKG